MRRDSTLSRTSIVNRKSTVVLWKCGGALRAYGAKSLLDLSVRLHFATPDDCFATTGLPDVAVSVPTLKVLASRKVLRRS